MHDLHMKDTALELACDNTIIEVGLAVLQAGRQGANQRHRRFFRTKAGEPAAPRPTRCRSFFSR